jgi:hypothetical protein
MVVFSMSIKKLLKLINDTGGTAQLLLWLFPSLALLLSVVTAYVANEPWYVILFYGSGAFCFVMVATDRLVVWRRSNTIFGKVRVVEQLGVTLGKVVPNDHANEQMFTANGHVGLQNRSSFDLYYVTEIAALSIDGRTSHTSNIDTNPVIMPSGAISAIHFPSISGLQPKPMTGQLHFKIRYGRRADALNRSYEIKGEPLIGVTLTSTGELVSVTSALAFKEIKYT